MVRRRMAVLGSWLLAAGMVAGCGSSGQPVSAPAPSGLTPSGGTSVGAPSGTAAPVEVSPQGDISDQVAYVPWTSPDGRIRFTHPEGWSQSAAPGGVRFAEKLNSVAVTAATGPAPTVGEVQAQVVPTLQASGTAVQIESVGAATLKAGAAVKVVWRVNSAPDPVTGKVYRDETVTYLIGAPGGRVVRMDLVGVVGSDNADPYRIMSDSLTLS